MIGRILSGSAGIEILTTDARSIRRGWAHGGRYDLIRILLAIAPMLLRFLVTFIAQDERIRRMGPRALLLIIPVATVGVVYFFTRSLVASLLLVTPGVFGPVGVYRVPTVARSHSVAAVTSSRRRGWEAEAGFREPKCPCRYCTANFEGSPNKGLT